MGKLKKIAFMNVNTDAATVIFCYFALIAAAFFKHTEATIVFSTLYLRLMLRKGKADEA